MKHTCNYCNYSTNDSSHFKRHLKSKKHKNNSLPDTLNKNTLKPGKIKVIDVANITYKNARKRQKTPENIGKKWICSYCNISFTRSNGLSKHHKTCPIRNNNINIFKEKEKQYKYELKEKDRYIKEKNIQIQKLENNFKEIIQNLGNMGPKNINAITYIINNYHDAPHIESIKPNTIKQLTCNTTREIEDIICYYKNKTFMKHIVKAIIFLYKKDDPTKQSIWSTDSSRNNYIIKELLHDKNSKWVIDKKGIKSETYLIDPILTFIRKKVCTYVEKVPELIKGNISKVDMEIMIENQNYGNQLIKEIDDGTLSTEIIKKLSKHMHHKKDNTPLIEEV